MFIPSLEYRRFVQRGRTAEEKRAKLTALALTWLKKRDCIFPKDTPIEVVVRDIEDSYERGLDILDPDLFPREDIIRFAEENGVAGDPMVIDFINRSRLGYVSH